MKIFILPSVRRLTWSPHAGGGMVVVARDRKAAKAFVKDFSTRPNKLGRPEVTAAEWRMATVYDLAGQCEPQVFIFPDAGCC